MTKPFELTATDALELINNKDLSYYEWIESCFNRIKERDIDVKAWIYLDEKKCLKESKAARRIK